MKQANNAQTTALYERLSVYDDQKNESVSIAHQKSMLEDYARKNGFTNVRHYTDDGVTGTSFNRPGLNEMVEEVKAGKITTVIIKDADVKQATTLFLGFYQYLHFVHI